MITYSRIGQRRLKQAAYVPVSTTMYTEDGPKVGTIWVRFDSPKFALHVTRVDERIIACQTADGPKLYSHKHFKELVEGGTLILVGIQEQHSITA